MSTIQGPIFLSRDGASGNSGAVQWVADRRFFSPRLLRWNWRRNLHLLKYDLSACAIMLAKIRLTQVEVDAMASYAGVPHVPLLSPALLT